MGVLRLDALVFPMLSDQLVSGFTTGASVHVFSAQLKVRKDFGLLKLVSIGLIWHNSTP